jgi:hypothetical protein
MMSGFSDLESVPCQSKRSPKNFVILYNLVTPWVSAIIQAPSLPNPAFEVGPRTLVETFEARPVTAIYLPRSRRRCGANSTLALGLPRAGFDKDKWSFPKSEHQMNG